ncbi:MAG TPA: serine protease [Candidatus Binatia bacterium]|nr:serine protease [Candidatus Binatia bacterium]
MSAQVAPSLVDTITFAGPPGAQLLGTGIVLSSTGLVITACHVVDGFGGVAVRIGGSGAMKPAVVVVADPVDDLALLEVQGPIGLHPAAIDHPVAAAVGDPVLAVGNAMGLGVAPRSAVGRIVAVDGSVSYGVGSATVRLAGTIEARAGIFEGDSGGALVDVRGRVIGIIAAGLGGGPCPAGAMCPMALTFAIPIDWALEKLGYRAA